MILIELYKKPMKNANDKQIYISLPENILKKPMSNDMEFRPLKHNSISFTFLNTEAPILR